MHKTRDKAESRVFLYGKSRRSDKRGVFAFLKNDPRTLKKLGCSRFWEPLPQKNFYNLGVSKCKMQNWDLSVS